MPSKIKHLECHRRDSRHPKGALKYLKGLAEPTGHGFDAYVQGNCNAKGNNVDDTGNYTSSITASSRASPSQTSQVSSSSATSANSTSSKKNDAAVEGAGFLGVIALAAGIALL